jgi:hypothetical protein
MSGYPPGTDQDNYALDNAFVLIEGHPRAMMHGRKCWLASPAG